MNYTEENYLEIISEIESSLEKLKQKCLVSGVIKSKDSRELLAQNALWLLQRVLFYSISVNEGTLSLMKTKNVLPAVHLIRANFEVVGILANLNSNLARYYSGEMDFTPLEQLIKSYALGSRTLEMKELPEPINIMKGIDAADKWFKSETKKQGEKVSENMFREAYNFLSEFAHPNFHGMNIVSSFENGIVRRASFEETHTNHALHILRYLSISNITFSHFYESCFQLLDQNEKLPISNRHGF